MRESDGAAAEFSAGMRRWVRVFRAGVWREAAGSGEAEERTRARGGTSRQIWGEARRTM